MSNFGNIKKKKSPKSCRQQFPLEALEQMLEKYKFLIRCKLFDAKNSRSLVAINC